MRSGPDPSALRCQGEFSVIVVQDRIEVAAADLERLQALLQQRYRPAAEQRGLEFVESQTSPPVRLKDGPSTVWLRWQVPDAQAWWAMRARSGADPQVAAFWAEVDRFCHSRERIYLSSANVAELPGAEDIAPFEVQTRGYRESAQLALREGLTEAQRQEFTGLLQGAADELPGLEAGAIGANLAPEYATGDYTWDLLYPDSESAAAARESAVWKQRVEPALERYCRSWDAVTLETLGAGLRRPGLRAGIKRTGYFRLLPGIGSELARRFEADLLEMAAQIPQILNWRLSWAVSVPWSRAGGEPWSYVWEQEYEELDGLTGPYMTHPHHWAHIDRWFDPESGVQAVDTDLSHAFCPFEDSLLTREARR